MIMLQETAILIQSESDFSNTVKCCNDLLSAFERRNFNLQYSLEINQLLVSNVAINFH